MRCFSTGGVTVNLRTLLVNAVSCLQAANIDFVIFRSLKIKTKKNFEFLEMMKVIFFKYFQLFEKTYSCFVLFNAGALIYEDKWGKKS